MPYENQHRTIKADWILKRIQEGKRVRLKNAVIEGDLNLSKLDLPSKRVERNKVQQYSEIKEDLRIIDSSIEITNSHFRGAVCFNYLILNKDVCFSGSQFEGFAYFNGSQFEGEARFSNSHFERRSTFEGVQFQKMLSLAMLIFKM